MSLLFTLFSATLVLLLGLGIVLGLRRRQARRKLSPTARPQLQLVPPEPAPVIATATPRSQPLKAGLAKTRGGFVARISSLLGRKQIDADLLDQLEEILFTADIGARTSAKLFEAVRISLSRDELREADQVWPVIRRESERLLAEAEQPTVLSDIAAQLQRERPLVLLTVGVNGVGKTTTIGKLAAKWTAQGFRVLLAAGDTFRAAAAEQLEIWGQRSNSPVVRGKEGADPSAVIFDAIKRAQAEQVDIVIADTAGRLHTKAELMEELRKVRRVVQKAMPSAPHETLLVLDATNGQNAIAQAAIFKQAMEISGIVLTKLDGTAKGGVVLGICDELKVPVRYVGIGEAVSDLREFNPQEFVEALYDRGQGDGDAAA